MPTRREVIVHGAASVALAGLACTRNENPLPPGAIRIPLDELPEGRRVVRMRMEEPIELIRTGSQVAARSLFCTHFGCRLSWNDDRGRYLCPCHEGAFDADGHPIAGPPIESMRQLPVVSAGESIIVLPRDAAAESG